MNQKYYFISDVHLGYGTRDSDRHRERRLLRLLQQIEAEARAGSVPGVFIVGDLFDSWFEFKSVVPRRHVRTLAALARIAELTQVDYLMGNHDFGHRDFFETELNIPIHRGDIERTLLGKRFFIAHGDGKAANDTGYLILRKVLRSSVAQFLYKLIHPDLGIPFAERMSHGSRAYTDQRDALQKQDGMREFAIQKLKSGKADFVVMGHRHRPMIEEVPNESESSKQMGIYVNLGDWISNYTYGVFDNNGLRIEPAPEAL